MMVFYINIFFFVLKNKLKIWYYFIIIYFIILWFIINIFLFNIIYIFLPTYIIIICFDKNNIFYFK